MLWELDAIVDHISVIMARSVSLMEEIDVPEENHRRANCVTYIIWMYRLHLDLSKNRTHNLRQV